MTLKECIKCKKNLSLDDFYIRTDSGKLRNACTKCMSSKAALWRNKNNERYKEYCKVVYQRNKRQIIINSQIWSKNNPELRKKYCRTWRWRLRLEVIFEYGGACCCCGEEQPEFLTIDHIFNDGGKKRKEGKQVVGGSFYRWLKQNNYPKDEFQLLCMNCNFAKGHYGGCPHNDH